MAKNSRKSKEATAEEANSVAPEMGASNGVGMAGQANPSAAKKAATKAADRAKAARKGRSNTPRKPSGERKPRAKSAQQSTAAGNETITDEAIQMRAYFISEWRSRHGVAGDSAHDWLEARRQLQEESNQSS